MVWSVAATQPMLTTAVRVVVGAGRGLLAAWLMVGDVVVVVVVVVVVWKVVAVVVAVAVLVLLPNRKKDF